MTSTTDRLWGQQGYVWDWTAGWLFGLGSAWISLWILSMIVPPLAAQPCWLSGILLLAGSALSVLRAVQIRNRKRTESSLQ